MTTLLAIDTATPNLVLGLQHQDQAYLAPAQQTIKHTDELLPALEQLLQQAQCKRSDLDAIAVGIGPGSFMGVRTAIAAAQGLALALAIPVIPLSSLAILAKTAQQQFGVDKVVAAWDARMHALYFGCYDWASGDLGPDQLLSPDELPALGTDWLCVGNAFAEYAGHLAPMPKGRVEAGLVPGAAAAIELGLQAYGLGQGLPAEQLEANYIRKKVTHG